MKRINDALDRATKVMQPFKCYISTLIVNGEDQSLRLSFSSSYVIGYPAIKALSEEFHTQELQLGSGLVGDSYGGSTYAETVIYLYKWS